MAHTKVSRVADRENEYRARHRKIMISPERVDPFADGKFNRLIFWYFLVILIQNFGIFSLFKAAKHRIHDLERTKRS